MAWPNDDFIANADDLYLARQEVAFIANAIAKHEPVWMYTSHENIPNAESFVSQNVSIVNLTVSHPWLRNTGPVIVTDSTYGDSVTGIDFNVRAGADRTLPQRILKRNDIHQISTSIHSEGSALETDGEGTLLVTESSLLNPDRNGDRDKFGMEDTFRELLGIEKTIWLAGVNDSNAADHHIDHLVRFGLTSKTVLLSRPHSSVSHSDPRYVAYEQARSVLSTSTNAAGDPFTIVEIEEAATVPRAEPEEPEDFEGEEDGAATRTHRRYTAADQALFVLDTATNAVGQAVEVVEPADNAATIRARKRDATPRTPLTSYVNFYLVNGAVIVPQFGEHRTDEAAVQTMKELFPDRVVETVMLNWMPWAGGGPHSSTLQWPKEGRC